MNKISIIIPIYNEAETIRSVLLYLENVISKKIPYEVIVVDGGSTDGSLEQINISDKIQCITSEKGRAKQMNAGAKRATGTILYFLHCDSFPPQDFDLLIEKEINKGNQAGCFRMKFDLKHPLLSICQWFTRFNHKSCRGGDQSLFVCKKLFDSIIGFDENCIIYEDNEIIERLYAKKQFVVIPHYLITSARKHKQNGVWKLQYHFGVIHLKKRMGHSINSLQEYYNRNII
ncbi:TIGR04283 family arsenosugar biosynthesis glycosyltransferase [Flavobacterium sp. NG2]|uniref:TIGR04283 family arsenosugar biosynthesis glycosyltransferase n=1 Tax=Flavobacterium sp. NG2 TaxID=3097547 RepID=UPI002A8275F6|nr:TIGR04283 family arsenosugar biosynthesis glycosyltransferase [Flavobacterium sp. NG2]WPR71414.1 TIGR04283 family arsenosugar biosynthesis glycosyltransferase [Flavobacterium sp. NG2]